MVKLIKFEPVMLARLDCIPTRRMGTRKHMFYSCPLIVSQSVTSAHLFCSLYLEFRVILLDPSLLPF